MPSDKDRELLAIRQAIETQIGRTVVGISPDPQAQDGAVIVKIGYVVIDESPLPERVEGRKITYQLAAPSRLDLV